MTAPALTVALAELETSRVAMAALIERRLWSRMTIALAVAVALWLASYPAEIDGLVVNLMFGATAGWIWAVGSRTATYRRRYKDMVLPLLAGELGDLTYRAAVLPDAAFLREQRLFGSFDRMTAEDEIVGSYHGVPVSIVELKLTQASGKTRRIVFDGLFVRIALPRMLTGVTAIAADIGVLGALRDLLSAQGGARVRVEDPEFERRYQVHATDPVSARALLTPAFMERFVALGARGDFRLPLAVAQGDELTVALPRTGGHDLFEPPRYDEAADAPGALARLHDDLCAVLRVADAVIDLDQSVRRRHAAVRREGSA